jgi:hypothetical protein
MILNLWQVVLKCPLVAPDWIGDRVEGEWTNDSLMGTLASIGPIISVGTESQILLITENENNRQY